MFIVNWYKLLLLSRVVCVGGDGIVHEVVNGLLEKFHGNVGIDLVDGTLPEKFNALPLNIRIGIIPAGTSFGPVAEFYDILFSFGFIQTLCNYINILESQSCNL